MPKSKKRRTARHRDPRKELRRRLAAPLSEPRPKHSSYGHTCPDDVLIAEFGEEGGSWLQEEYGRSLTLAEFALERSIRVDEFLLDDPISGPEVVAAEEISKLMEMAADVILAMAERQGVLTKEMAREIAETNAMPSIDHASEGADVVRSAFQMEELILNDRDMWDFSEYG
ncbi:hypothetical protein ACFYPN_31975 [Streptomyces sp. NPDC005576]|uniref:hypothetical protein n=1 Tax=unclassified Streptomyces TaxID=2593676 RepID=UPI0033E75AF4